MEQPDTGLEAGGGRRVLGGSRRGCWWLQAGVAEQGWPAPVPPPEPLVGQAGAATEDPRDAGCSQGGHVCFGAWYGPRAATGSSPCPALSPGCSLARGQGAGCSPSVSSRGQDPGGDGEPQLHRWSPSPGETPTQPERPWGQGGASERDGGARPPGPVCPRPCAPHRLAVFRALSKALPGESDRPAEADFLSGRYPMHTAGPERRLPPWVPGAPAAPAPHVRTGRLGGLWETDRAGSRAESMP